MGQYVLILNASYEFLNVASIRRAVKLICKGKAEVVESYPDRVLRSISGQMQAPSIIRMRYYIIRPFKEAPLTKKNILIRDQYVCQYCGNPGNTVDHLIPRSKGGDSSWENCVCACSGCNSRKKNRTPREAEMKLLRHPNKPRFISKVVLDARKNGADWEKYIFWNVDIS
jgi:5-methylcytosine-specific restriction endonuclease McrA